MISHPPTDHLHQFIDNELAQAERQSLESHLQQCAACASKLDEIRGVGTYIVEAADMELSYSFGFYLQRALEREGTNERSWGGVETVARNAVAAIALLVIIMTVLSVFAENGSEFPAETAFVAGQSDSVAARILNKQSEISRDDLILAVVTR